MATSKKVILDMEKGFTLDGVEVCKMWATFPNEQKRFDVMFASSTDSETLANGLSEFIKRIKQA